ncbi:MAG: hypothetical protein CMP48_13270 [Rickettsiales bacterium]|nr:hypothetical protein [Rickettsiales bacterium]
MKPLIVLVVMFIVAIVFNRIRQGKAHLSLSGRVAMMAMLCFTAMGHFMFIDGMSAMLPDFVPAKNFIVLATGVIEILFGIGLLISSITKWTGWLLILFFIAILPANIYAAIHSINYQTGELNGPGVEYLWFRVPMQILFIGWVYYFTIRIRKSQI